jgi:hypothetical protein
MNQHIKNLLILLLLFSCKEKEVSKKILKKETISSKKTSTKQKTNSFIEFESLLNHKLTGLSIINENATDTYKKYGLDSDTVCFCNTPSLFIDTNTMALIVFNYCDSTKSIDDIEKKYTYKIIKIERNSNEIVLITDSNLKIIFKKNEKSPLFDIKIEGQFPTDFVGSDLKKVVTTTPEKFIIVDCGDFDG